jgi:hypothetical protein
MGPPAVFGLRSRATCVAIHPLFQRYGCTIQSELAGEAAWGTRRSGEGPAMAVSAPGEPSDTTVAVQGGRTGFASANHMFGMRLLYRRRWDSRSYPTLSPGANPNDGCRTGAAGFIGFPCSLGAANAAHARRGRCSSHHRNDGSPQRSDSQPEPGNKLRVHRRQRGSGRPVPNEPSTSPRC